MVLPSDSSKPPSAATRPTPLRSAKSTSPSATPSSSRLNTKSPKNNNRQLLSRSKQSAVSSGMKSRSTSSKKKKKKKAKSKKKKKKKAIVEDPKLVRDLIHYAASSSIDSLKHCFDSLQYADSYDLLNGQAGQAFVVACEKGHIDIVQLLLQRTSNQALSSDIKDVFHNHSELSVAQTPSSPPSQSSSKPTTAKPNTAASSSSHQLLASPSFRHAQHSVLILPTQPFTASNPHPLVNLSHLSVTPLHAAAKAGQDNVVALLLQYGADINAATPFEHYTALHFACLNSRVAVVKLLLNAEQMCSQRVDVNARCNDAHCGVYNGWSALHFAASSNCLQAVELLLTTTDINTDIDAVDAQQSTAAAVAAEQGNWEIVKMLVEKGANIAAKHRGLSLVEWSIYRANCPMIEYLTAAGALADLNVRTAWFKESLGLKDLMKSQVSEEIFNLMDASLYRGQQRVKHKQALAKMLSAVRWEVALIVDPYSFEVRPKARIEKFPEAVINCIVSYES